jgi:16S rRNA G966 N2-methylase RsmD
MDPSVVLRRAADLTIRLRSGGKASVRVGDDSPLECSVIVLRVLDLFASPRTMAEALDTFAARGVEDYIEASSLVLQLARIGALLAPSQSGAVASATRGFDRPAIHISMLDDRARTQAFISALAEVIRPGDVVVDIGTGTGVLAIAAARAGARHVYAIEEGRIADAAQALVTANGLGDRVTVVRGRSTRVVLPEQATVLVSETIGNDPLDESIVETLRDARARLLAPGARTVPRELSVHALPVDLPTAFIETRRFGPKAIARWNDAYAIDFSSLADYGGDETFIGSVSAAEASKWSVVGEPIELARIDFSDAGRQDSDFDGEADAHVTATASNLGFVIYFDAALSKTLHLSNDPRTTVTTNWESSVYYVRAVPAGARVRVAWKWRGGESELTVQ